MIDKIKSRYQRMRELRDKLVYFQMQVRINIRALKASIAKVKEIAAEMRQIQRGE